VLLAEAGDDAVRPLLGAMSQAIPAEGRGFFWLSTALPAMAACTTANDNHTCPWEASVRAYQGCLFDWHLPDIELGRLAVRREDWDGARRAFERAADLCRAGGLDAFLGQVFFQHGLMLLKRGDRRAGSEMLRGAESMLAGLGLEYLAERARSLVTRPVRGRPMSKGPAGLTGRELEVLCLASQGGSNREIARQLVISERTVERHLENAYAKLGVENRGAAIAWYVRQGLEDVNKMGGFPHTSATAESP